MFEPAVAEELSVALANALLLALWAVLPGLLVAYIRQFAATRGLRPEFTLRKSEAAELDRAVLLYNKARNRLKEIADQVEKPNGFWPAIFGRPSDKSEPYAGEIEDLEAHAHHLRATIIRLRRRPLQRLRSWIRALCLRAALGRALATHVAGFALLIVSFFQVLLQVSGQVARADALMADVSDLLTWYPFDERIFYANAIAAGFAAAATPLFYFARWAGLRREYALEYCTLKELAGTDPAQIGDQSQVDQDEPGQSSAGEDAAGDDWVTVLGLAPSPTIEEVKAAYRTLIRQNHPDRVYGMSAAFRTLAEAETRKINAAYQQALIAISPIEASPAMAPVD